MNKSGKHLSREYLEIADIAKLDPQRERTTGIPEVILARGKDPDEVLTLAQALLEKKGHVIITKAEKAHFTKLEEIGGFEKNLNHKAGVAVFEKKGIKKVKHGKVAVFAAGTSDISVAEEARMILEELGCEALPAYDIGIAGIHRVLPWTLKVEEEDVDVIIVVAGMEGALASVVKSMVDVPVIGVPTSIGYGYGGGGISALMGMLQSCSPGITVVNIDNGFGAAAAASLICRKRNRGGR